MNDSLPPYLFEQPDPTPPPPVSTRAQLLPFDQLTWKNFERLCLRVAERVDRIRDPRLYGTSGQSQHGIDLWGTTANGTSVVYQVRNIRKLTDRALKSAVIDFAEGKRPFSPRRFVLCVAASGSSTEVQEALSELRNRYSDLEIVLYDQERLSTLLKNQPDIVDDFFGKPWRDHFCVVGSPETFRQDPDSPRKITADMLLRGPVAALGLAGDLKRADSLSDRAAAAQIYGRVAEELEHRGWGLPARLIRQRQGDALLASGEIEAAYLTWLALLKDEVHTGALLVAPTCSQRLEDHRDKVRPALAARFVALKGLDTWFENPEAGIKLLRDAVTSLLGEDDPWAADAALWLAEATLVDELDHEEVTAVCKEVLERFGARSDEAVVVRLRLALAEFGGDWTELLREASSGRLGPKDAGLVFARYGRELGLAAQWSEAIDEYRRAIEKLTQTDLYGDVAQSLYAISKLQFTYGTDFTGAGEVHTLARAIPDKVTRLTRNRDSRAAALRALHAGRLPDAHQSLRRYLWESRLSGHLSTELEARELIGDLYVEAGEFAAAVANYIRAGCTEKVTETVRRCGKPVDVSADLWRETPWVQVTALAEIAEQGDVLPPDWVHRIESRLVELTDGADQSPMGRKVVRAAWAALAGVAYQLSSDACEAVLYRIESLLSREPGHDRLIGNYVGTLLGRFHYTRPSLRHLARTLIARSLNHEDLAWRLRDYLVVAVDLDEHIRQALMSEADGGNRVALEVLALAEIHHERAAEEANSLAKRIMSYQPGQARKSWSLTLGFEDAAVFVRLLPIQTREEVARHLMALVEDVGSPEFFRNSALNGVSVLANTLSSQVRGELFESAFRLANPDTPVSLADVTLRAMLHPLSRVRLDFGVGSLWRTAIETAGQLAVSADQAQQLRRVVYETFHTGDEKAIAAAGSALLALERSMRPSVDLYLLSTHTSPWVRSLAARLWLEEPTSAPDLGEWFVRDSDRRTRLVIADSLPRLAQLDPKLHDHLRAVLSEDPSALVRARAQGFQPN